MELTLDLWNYSWKAWQKLHSRTFIVYEWLNNQLKCKTNYWNKRWVVTLSVKQSLRCVLLWYCIRFYLWEFSNINVKYLCFNTSLMKIWNLTGILQKINQKDATIRRHIKKIWEDDYVDRKNRYNMQKNYHVVNH
jgi:hypothetical protein